MTRVFFLKEDFLALGCKIKELQEKIKKLGKEQGEAANQSTENFGHDDACQEAVDHERRMTIIRLASLRDLVQKASVVTPSNTSNAVSIGSTVELSDGRIYKIGSYMIFAENPVTNISYCSPLGKLLIGKVEGDEIEFRGKRFEIKRIR